MCYVFVCVAGLAPTGLGFVTPASYRQIPAAFWIEGELAAAAFVRKRGAGRICWE